MSGRNTSCLFYDPYEDDCAVWSEEVAPTNGGHVTFLSWDWSKSNFHQPLVQYQGSNRQSLSWPELSWRAALSASRNPKGSVVTGTPTLDLGPLFVSNPLRVALLATATDFQSVTNIKRFLELSNHTVSLLHDVYNGAYVANFLSTVDGLVVPNPLYSYYNGYPSTLLSLDAKNAIRNFTKYDGGRVVVAGRRSALFLNDLFGTYLAQPEVLSYTGSIQPYFGNEFSTKNDLIFNFGLDLISHQTNNTRFSSFYNSSNSLPGMIPSTSIFPYLITDASHGAD